MTSEGARKGQPHWKWETTPRAPLPQARLMLCHSSSTYMSFDLMLHANVLKTLPLYMPRSPLTMPLCTVFYAAPIFPEATPVRRHAHAM